MPRSTLLAFASVAALAATTVAAAPKPPIPAMPADAPARLVGGALASGAAYERLAGLCDGIGARLSGSPGAAAAVQWALAGFRADGVRAWTEPVLVPHWVRGEERAEVLAAPPARPRPQPLAVTALGGSPPTPPGGLVAGVVELGSLEELDAAGDKVKGKVVLFQHPMASAADYGRFSRLRSRGPAAAARLGAAGALVRSLATASFRTPHTGQTTFPADVRPIPAAAVSTEDAELLHRLLAKGPVEVRLVLGCGPGEPPEVESANVVAEIRGRERPDEVVVIGAHLDSWDLGTGAVDDGAGVVMVMEAMRQVARLGVPPRRTLRAVLFMNEENGLRGGVAYAKAHAAELPKHVAALEADEGAGRPVGVSVDAGPGAVALLARAGAPLRGLGAGAARDGHGGADLDPMRYAGVPVLSLDQDASRYFDLHHSGADTFDKVSPAELAACSAAVTSWAFALAEADEVLARPPPPTEPAWWLPAPAAPPTVR